MWYMYILECADKSLYVGVTSDLELRFKQHVSGRGGNFTSRNRPTKILYREEFDLRSMAVARENQVKRWTRAKKLALACGDLERLSSLSVSKD